MHIKRLQNLWYDLSLRKRLVLYFSVLIFASLVIAFYSFRTTYFYMGHFQTTLEEHFRLNAFLKELQSHASVLDEMFRWKTEKDFQKNAETLAAGVQRLQSLLASIKLSAGGTKEALFETRALENSLDSYTHLLVAVASKTDKRSVDFFQKMYTLSRIGYYMEQYTANLQRIQLSKDALYYDSVERTIAFSRWMFVLVLLLVTAVFIRFALLFSKRFSEPISKLAESSERMASGDLSVLPVHSENTSGKEIKTLITAFNTMSRSIKDMVDDLKMKSELEKKLHTEELEKESALGALREAQLISLQNQIKPHFLFNTLNIIGRQAQEENAGQTSKLILFLSHLMRYNLLSHRHSVCLADELHALTDYMHLQQKRFGSRIHFVLDCPHEFDAVQIPPFTVLSFAENSVKHGLEPLVAGGTLYIRVRKRSQCCRICIADTGSGMSAQTLYKVRHTNETSKTAQSVANGENPNGIGVRNSIKRLELFYGERYSFACYSKLNRGTLTIITVPLLKEAELLHER